MKGQASIILALSLAMITCGCVRRLVTINSEPEGARVYLDRKFIGQTPCTHEFFYYGGHHLELVKEDYANLKTTLELKGPIYEYFPLSFFSEVLIPWTITNRHQASFKLDKGQTKDPVISPIKQPQAPLPETRLERMQNVQ